MRQYWPPAALVDEFDGPRPVRKVRLLGEDSVLFRDLAGRYGLLDRHCAHRGADLSYSRAEDGGLRCPFRQRVRQPAYRCTVAGGIVFAFKGLIECNWLQALEVGTDPGLILQTKKRTS